MPKQIIPTLSEPFFANLPDHHAICHCTSRLLAVGQLHKIVELLIVARQYYRTVASMYI